ncbi:hypothetical protein G5V58_20680 [Nocardioides anomalus]|uniref:Uncharacterized protein n=1 Tax=Nocardioides anomalus TaxID=2712223 RepID=A0A6G6WI06_9ACTN|nr:hypothetical protein [Nocardioides anomalus]QIG44874.1 hypothetical protein G5V58_20680 [Nocardioides anomalus]
MGVRVMLHRRDGELVRALPDPGGGTFDAACDFDALIGSATLPTIGGLDPHGDATLGGLTMADLIADVDNALESARPGPRLRGLRRLRAMAEMVQADESLTLRVVGDQQPIIGMNRSSARF